MVDRVVLGPEAWKLHEYDWMHEDGSYGGHYCCLTTICPGCGKDWTMSKRVHSISDDGTVSPSYVCPGPPCTFHQFVRLEGWKGPDRRTV